MKILIFGPPGVGKGTNSKHVVEKYDIPHISTGDIIRSGIANETELGKAASAFIAKGELVPDSLLVDMIKEQIEGKDKFILDGYPRTVPQARLLDRITKIDLLLILSALDDVLVRRLLDRGRQGETEAIIKNRLDVYRSETAPVINYYGGSNTARMIRQLDGSGTIDEVNLSIGQTIEMFRSFDYASRT